VKITLIKKIKADGSPCKKCEQVLSRLEKEGHLPRIDDIVVADERDPESEGMRLAAKHGVELAPFFIVEGDAAEPRIYTTYHRFVKEVLEAASDEEEADKEILEKTDLDFI
jgi:hypothetical protein